jgi:hypothetical protein
MKMFNMSKKISAAILGLFILFAAAMPADAQYRNRGRLSGGEKAAAIGGSAAAGALIGGLLGGKKGAVIGGLVGAGGGTGYVLYRGRDDDRYRRNYRGRYNSNDWRFDNNRRFYNWRSDRNWRNDRGIRNWDRSNYRFNRR